MKKKRESEEMTMRYTKIICTLGPSTDTEEAITQLLQAGMNVARLEFFTWHP